MEVQEIKIKDVVQVYNSRSDVASGVDKMMKSIDRDGLQEPIKVRKTAGKKYEVIFGNRRLDACRKLGHKEISAIIVGKNVSQQELIVLNLVENIQREDISPYQEGKTIDELIRKYKMSYAEVGARLGRTTKNMKGKHSIFKETPKEFRDKVVNVNAAQKRNQKGVIPTKVAQDIISHSKTYSLNRTQRTKLFKMSEDRKINATQIGDMAKSIGSGRTVEQAFKGVTKFKTVTIHLQVEKTGWDDEVAKVGVSNLNDICRSAIYKKLGLKRPKV